MFKRYLRVDGNKTELFQLIAESVISKCDEMTTTVYTRNTDVISNVNIVKDCLPLCNHEEADKTISSCQ